MHESTVSTEPLDTMDAQVLAALAALQQIIPDTLNPAHQRHGPKRAEPVQGPGLRRQRLKRELLRQALAFARAVATEADDMAAILAQLQATQRQYGALSRLGRGWLDCRHVWQTRLQVDTNPNTGALDARLVKVAFGPYVYYRWNEGGKKRSLYLGRHDEPERWVEKLTPLGVDLADLGRADLQALVPVSTAPAASADALTETIYDNKTVTS